MPVAITIRYVIGAAIAVICQAILSANIQMGFATPNFILCYVIACSLARPANMNPILPFVCGLIFDIMSGGPIGAMAFICVLVSVLVSASFNLVENSSLPMVIIFCIVTCIVSETVYGALMIACGASVGLLEAFASISLPSALYDILISLLAYVLCARFVFRDKEQIEMTIIDSGSE